MTGFVGSLDVDLELGLLVLLDAERAAAVIEDHELVNAQGRIRRQLERPIETTEGVGHKRLRQDFLTLRIVDLDIEGLVGEVAGVRADRSGIGPPRT